MNPIRHPRKGFTLLEVLFTSLIALFGCLSIMGGLYFVNRAQKYARERTRAQTIAASKLEEARQVPFSELATEENLTVTVDDNRTPGDTSDDVAGKLSLILYRPSDGGQIPSTLGESYVQVEAQVTWYGAGSTRESGTEKKVSLVSQFAP